MTLIAPKIRSCFLLGCVALLLAPGIAGADGHHQILSQGPIKKGGKVVGFRATVLVDPDGITSEHAQLGGDVRLGLGAMKFDLSKAGTGAGDPHRDAAAGVVEGYVLHQFKMREITGPTTKDRGPLTETLKTGGKPKEVEVEVLYKDNPKLIPGMDHDLVAGFWKGNSWHIWGAAHGPVHSTRDFVLKLPGAASPRFIQRQLKALSARLGQARADVSVSQQKFDAAEKAQKDAQAAKDAIEAKLQPAQNAMNQTYRDASADYQQAMDGPQAAYDLSAQAANTQYQNAMAGPTATYRQATADAQSARMAYNAAHDVAIKAREDALKQAQATLDQANKGPLSTYQRVTHAARVVYDAEAQKLNYAAVSQQAYAANEALSAATDGKLNAEAVIKTLNDKITQYEALTPKRGAPKVSAR